MLIPVLENRGFQLERDLEGLFMWFDSSRPDCLFQTGGVTPADAVGEAVAVWKASNDPNLQGTEATNQPVLAAFGGGLGVAFDSTNDLLNFQATCGAFLNGASAFTMYWAVKTVDLASSFKRLCWISDGTVTPNTRVDLVQTHDPSADILSTRIREVDAGTSVNTTLPSIGIQSVETVYALSYNANGGALKWYENGQHDPATMAATVSLSGNAFSATNSTAMRLGESSGAVFGVWGGCTAVHSDARVLQVTDIIRARHGL